MKIWSEETCKALNRYQNLGIMHPYTCGNDSNHKVLVAKEDGWHCPDCDYRQTTASKFMIEIGNKTDEQLRKEGFLIFERGNK